MKTVIALIIAATVAGCASAKHVQMPNGKQGFNVSCDGAAVPVVRCYNKAAELCPNGYSIIDKNGSQGPVFANRVGNAVMFSSMQRKSILIQCS